MRPSKTFCSICIAAISSLATATAQTLPQTDKPRTTTFEVSIDALGALQRQLSSYGQYEAALRMNLNDKMFPIVEVGLGDCDKTEETTKLHYTSSAPYARLGVDFNMLKDKHDAYRVYVGLRAAYTSFKYDLTSTEAISDPVWGDTGEISQTGVSCNYLWAELVAGVQARIIGPVHLGWSLRYKNRIHQKYGDAGEPWYVSGFGKRGASRLGGTFNIIVAF